MYMFPCIISPNNSLSLLYTILSSDSWAFSTTYDLDESAVFCNILFLPFHLFMAMVTGLHIRIIQFVRLSRKSNRLNSRTLIYKQEIRITVFSKFESCVFVTKQIGSVALSDDSTNAYPCGIIFQWGNLCTNF